MLGRDLVSGDLKKRREESTGLSKVEMKEEEQGPGRREKAPSRGRVNGTREKAGYVQYASRYQEKGMSRRI